MLTQDEGQTPPANRRWPQRDRIRKVGRIGSLLCTLTLILFPVLAVLAAVAAFYFGSTSPQTRELWDIFISAGVRNPVTLSLFVLTGATWVYAIWILRRVFLEFNRGIVFSVRNARAICWLGVLTLFGMISFNPSAREGKEPPQGLIRTEAPAESISGNVAPPINEHAPRVGSNVSVKETTNSAAKETSPDGSLFKDFTVGFDVEYLLFGLLLLAIGWGWEKGVALQEEQDLTI